MYCRIITTLIAVALLAEMRTPDASANPPTRYQRYAEVPSRGPRVVPGKPPSTSKPRQLGQPLRPVTPITPIVPKPRKPSKRPVPGPRYPIVPNPWKPSKRPAKKVAINAAVLSNRAGLEGVRIVFRNTRTDSAGYRVTGAKGTASLFYVPRGMSYEITPSKTGYAFLPPSYKMTATGPRSIRFEAKKVSPAPVQPKKAPIAVYVLDENGRGLRGAEVVFKNAQTGTTGERYADSSGKCSDFWGYSEAKYLVTAEKAGCQFQPPSISVDLQRHKLTLYTLYFTKKREETKLIAKVLSGGNPVVGVRVDFKNIATGNTGWRKTLRTGRCQDFWVPVGGDYSITPRSDDYVFTPRTKTVSSRSTASQTVTFEARRKAQDNGEPNIGSSSQALSSERHKITVRTADVERAGTDANITIELIGSDGCTAEVSLDEEDRNDHERGQPYDFIRDLPSLGDSPQMWVRSDGYHPVEGAHWEILPFPHLAGDLYAPGDAKWFPLGFEVEHATTSERWYFSHYGWIKWGVQYLLTGYRWEDTVEYEIKVETATVEYAGTDADVFLQIFDRQSNPLPVVLLDNRAENFEAGSTADTDTFTCRLPKVEDISWINLTHNDRGAHSDWFVGSVEITRTDNRQSWVFIGNQWIARSIRDQNGRGASLWLEAKPPEETARYRIEVVTSSEDHAGTNAKVYLQIWNGQTPLPWIQLDDEDNNFEVDKHDEFNYRMLRSDSIPRIRLWHDNTKKHPGWLPENVEITTRSGGYEDVTYSFSNPDERWAEITATTPPDQGALLELWRTVPPTPVR